MKPSLPWNTREEDRLRWSSVITSTILLQKEGGSSHLITTETQRRVSERIVCV